MIDFFSQNTALPSKKFKKVTSLVDHDLKATWFFVQSPREVYGVVGPFSVIDLATMYKYGDINDDTYLWQEGQHDDLGNEMWKALRDIVTLRFKIINVPDVPLRVVDTAQEIKGDHIRHIYENN